MPNILEHLRQRPTEAPLLKLPVNSESLSLTATDWAKKALKPLKNVDNKEFLAEAFGKWISDLSTIDEVHAVAIRVFDQTSRRPYISLLAFSDITPANSDQGDSEPFLKTLEAHHNLGIKISPDLGYGSRTRPLKLDQVDEALTEFMKPAKGNEGKILGAVQFQRS